MRSNNEGKEVFLYLFVLAGQKPLDHNVQFKLSGSLLRNIDIKEKVQRRITNTKKDMGLRKKDLLTFVNGKPIDDYGARL